MNDVCTPQFCETSTKETGNSRSHGGTEIHGGTEKQPKVKGTRETALTAYFPSIFHRFLHFLRAPVVLCASVRKAVGKILMARRNQKQASQKPLGLEFGI